MNDVTSRFSSLIRDTRAYLEYAALAGLDFAPRSAPPSANLKAGLECPACPFRTSRDGLFRGWGNDHPRLTFVSTTPPPPSASGEYSPFTGEHGELLLKIIKSPKLDDKDLSLCFALRCMPPHGTEPEAIQRAYRACAPLLREEIKRLNPEVVLAMGEEACEALTGKSDIKASRGRFSDFQGIKVMPTYGIDELLKDKGLKKEVWADIQLAMKALKS